MAIADHDPGDHDHQLITTTQETTLVNAMNVMRDNQIGCLPAVRTMNWSGSLRKWIFFASSSRLLERS